METETIKVIRQPDGRINIVNKDGLGVLLENEEALETWILSNEPDDQWIEDLKDIARSAHEKNPKLQGIENIKVDITRKSITIK